MTSMSFGQASLVEPAGEHRYRAQIPAGWEQGRGAFGGLVLGTLLRAIERDEPDAARVTRTLSGDICGPVKPGPADIRVRLLRRGNNQSNLAAELTQGGEVLATATAVLSPPRVDQRHPGFLPPPPPADWRAHPALVSPGPSFALHYEYRDAGSSERAIHSFIREREPPAVLDRPALIGRLDAWWPTLFQLEGPRPMATISFTAEILADPASLPAAEPLRYRAQMAALSDGFLVEMRELWHGETVVALNQQTFAILR
jgi:acyl-CoA thioesterase